MRNISTTRANRLRPVPGSPSEDPSGVYENFRSDTERPDKVTGDRHLTLVPEPADTPAPPHHLRPTLALLLAAGHTIPTPRNATR